MWNVLTGIIKMDEVFRIINKNAIINVRYIWKSNKIEKVLLKEKGNSIGVTNLILILNE